MPAYLATRQSELPAIHVTRSKIFCQVGAQLHIRGIEWKKNHMWMREHIL
jgi:hypothetical protein